MLSHTIAFFAGASAMAAFCWFIWPTAKADIAAAEAKIKSKLP